jgi:hypothetical protein
MVDTQFGMAMAGIKSSSFTVSRRINDWRKVAAHQGTTLPAGIALDLPSLRAWRISCHELATFLDDIVYNHLRKILRRVPGRFITVEIHTMAIKKSSPIFQLADRVKIRHWDWQVRIVELRGPLGPGGSFVYRVRVPHKPKATYIELREDQWLLIPTTPKVESHSSTKPHGSSKR